MPQTSDIVDIHATIAYMADELRPLLARKPVMVGIHTGGAWIAEHLHRLLAQVASVFGITVPDYLAA